MFVMKKPIIIDVLLITCFESFANSSDFKSFIAGDRQIKGNNTLQVTVLPDKGDKLNNSNPESFKYFYNLAIEKSRLLQKSKCADHFLALAYIGLAVLDCNMGDYPESDRKLSIALRIAGKATDADVNTQAINIKGLIHYNQSSYDSAVMSYQEASKFAEMEKEIRQQKVFIYFATGLLISLFIFVIFLNIYYRKKIEMLYQKHLDQLTILKMQNIRNRISPHFIFNMLSSISHSVHQPELLINKISNMSMLLRKIIENIEQTAIPLDEELSIVKAFVELQRDKVAAPFNFNIIIEPSIDREMLIPAMIIQIAAENSLKHGLMTMEQGPCDLTIKVAKQENESRITISDNGAGLSNQVAKKIGTGTGLKMVMQTIHFLNSKNKSKILFSVTERKDAEPASPGTITEIVIPDNYSFKI
jgi:tetratricopeptide (TPR) repeat protein